MRSREEGRALWGVGTPEVFFCPLRSQTFSFILRVRVMDLLKACDEMKGFLQTAQKLVEVWDADPDNYSQLEEGLSALKAELEKFKVSEARFPLIHCNDWGVQNRRVSGFVGHPS